jgi:hypothetical protein
MCSETRFSATSRTTAPGLAAQCVSVAAAPRDHGDMDVMLGQLRLILRLQELGALRDQFIRGDRKLAGGEERLDVCSAQDEVRLDWGWATPGETVSLWLADAGRDRDVDEGDRVAVRNETEFDPDATAEASMPCAVLALAAEDLQERSAALAGLDVWDRGRHRMQHTAAVDTVPEGARPATAAAGIQERQGEPVAVAVEARQDEQIVSGRPACLGLLTVRR